MNDIVRIGSMQIRYLVDGSGTGGLGLFELSVPPGAHVPPPHSHSDNEECVYVLEGVLRYTVDGVTRDLGPGQHMSTPRGSVHHFCNPAGATADARALIVLTPDIGMEFFREVGAIVGAGGPPDRTKIVAVMARHGLKLAAPAEPVAG